jgi:hypothetical protein
MSNNNTDLFSMLFGINFEEEAKKFVKEKISDSNYIFYTNLVALVEILIDKKIISEDELQNYIDKHEINYINEIKKSFTDNLGEPVDEDKYLDKQDYNYKVKVIELLDFEIEKIKNK